MDIEIRELWRAYQNEPTWNLAYRLLRANQRATGEIISEGILKQFTLSNFIPPLLRAITRMHETQIHAPEIEEYELFDNMQVSIRLIDNVEAAHQGFIPDFEDKPFTFLVTLYFLDDLHSSGPHLTSRLVSIVLGNDTNNISGTLNSLIFYELRNELELRGDYSSEYIYGQPWGYQGVLPIPKSEWLDGRDQHHLMLLNTFYPDEVMWNIFLTKQFG